MKLALLLWLANVLPPSVADPLCLATTIYLEARGQSELGQRAVAEVVLRRRDSGRWGNSMCTVVTAAGQFAPTLLPGSYRVRNLKAWNRAVAVAYSSIRDWRTPYAGRFLLVPGADHFHVDAISDPAWARGTPVARIGDHTFYRVATVGRRRKPGRG